MTQAQNSSAHAPRSLHDPWLFRMVGTISASTPVSVGLVFLCSWAVFYHYQFLTPFIPGTDGYYHIKFAYLMRTEGFLKVFRWASMSIWAEKFYDKEFLYHVYLIPFTYFKDLAFGAKLATVLLASISTTSFYAILRLNRIRLASVWFLVLLCGGAYFLYRNNVPRPQVLSIILAQWSIHFILNRQRILLAIVGVVYVFSYTAYFLPVVFSVIVSGYLFFFEDEIEWKTPLVALGAMIVGMLIHPYFPHNFVYLYVQNFYVLWMSAHGKVDLRMGNEFGPMDTRQLIGANTTAAIALIGAFFAAIYRPKAIDKTTRCLFFLALSLILLTFHTKRFTEYSVPVTLMFCAFFFHHHLIEFQFRELWQQQRHLLLSWIAVLGLLLASLAVGSYKGTAPQFSTSQPRLTGAALYLKKHTNKNEVVFTCDWDDGPELIFYNHHSLYLVFLDPNFMYFWKPKLWHTWDDLAHGRKGAQTYDLLKNFFKVRYGVCTREFWGLRNLIAQHPKIKIVYSDRESYVFRLN